MNSEKRFPKGRVGNSAKRFPKGRVGNSAKRFPKGRVLGSSYWYFMKIESDSVVSQ
ncbi:Uncharacterized protein NV38_0002369 [Leptospira kirschneri serovar Mozdok]|nr:Uncharacterized protein NV38_0002369 [Leptospira kirschneri serovar Mozdok]